MRPVCDLFALQELSDLYDFLIMIHFKGSDQDSWQSLIYALNSANVCLCLSADSTYGHNVHKLLEKLLNMDTHKKKKI